MLFSENQSSQGQGNSFRTGVNVFYLLVSGFTTSFTVFFRRSFGGEALGINAIASVAIMLLFLMSYPRSAGLSQLFCLWWGALILQRLGHFQRRFRGVYIHSRFDGISWFETILPFINTVAARMMEIGSCLALGLHFEMHDRGLSQFFLLGSAALLLKFLIDQHLDHLQMRRLNDATIMQQAMVARWRGGRL